jgi:hypothetical protein
MNLGIDRYVTLQFYFTITISNQSRMVLNHPEILCGHCNLIRTRPFVLSPTVARYEVQGTFKHLLTFWCDNNKSRISTYGKKPITTTLDGLEPSDSQ